MTVNRSLTPVAERLESLKAGAISAISALVAYSSLALASLWLTHFQEGEIAWSGTGLGISSSIALLNGFLFGVTYRYIIRADQNPHLKSGAVLAFGLVRGLAQVEGAPQLWESPWLAGLQVIESIGLFITARLVLDWAMQRGWLKAFKS